MTRLSDISAVHWQPALGSPDTLVAGLADIVAIEATVPADGGSWTVREAGISDAAGKLIAAHEAKADSHPQYRRHRPAFGYHCFQL